MLRRSPWHFRAPAEAAAAVIMVAEHARALALIIARLASIAEMTSCGATSNGAGMVLIWRSVRAVRMACVARAPIVRTSSRARLGGDVKEAGGYREMLKRQGAACRRQAYRPSL